MDNILFITAMSVYIVSAMLALVLAIVSKNTSKQWIYLIATMHVLLLIAFLVSEFFISDQSKNASYFFLAYFSTGLILFGLIIRKKVNIIFKVYSALFICSILIFVIKPSKVITFITQTPKPIEVEYLLDDNLYLIKQDPLLNKGVEDNVYKVSKKLGSFHRTLARNIVFENNFDSVEVLNLTDTLITINTLIKDNNSISNNNVTIDLTKLKKRDNANIQ